MLAKESLQGIEVGGRAVRLSSPNPPPTSPTPLQT